jgi:hypothetical protein
MASKPSGIQLAISSMNTHGNQTMFLEQRSAADALGRWKELTEQEGEVFINYILLLYLIKVRSSLLLIYIMI